MCNKLKWDISVDSFSGFLYYTDSLESTGEDFLNHPIILLRPVNCFCYIEGIQGGTKYRHRQTE